MSKINLTLWSKANVKVTSFLYVTLSHVLMCILVNTKYEHTQTKTITFYLIQSFIIKNNQLFDLMFKGQDHIDLIFIDKN